MTEQADSKRADLARRFTQAKACLKQCDDGERQAAAMIATLRAKGCHAEAMRVRTMLDKSLKATRASIIAELKAVEREIDAMKGEN